MQKPLMIEVHIRTKEDGQKRNRKEAIQIFCESIIVIQTNKTPKNSAVIVTEDNEYSTYESFDSIKQQLLTFATNAFATEYGRGFYVGSFAYNFIGKKIIVRADAIDIHHIPEEDKHLKLLFNNTEKDFELFTREDLIDAHQAWRGRFITVGCERMKALAPSFIEIGRQYEENTRKKEEQKQQTEDRLSSLESTAQDITYQLEELKKQG